ncbi:MAG TPA: MATE family efflux transporter [Clostridiales bacterium]|nr:MATE family efflux transporter [Clostridiales bacterium]
MTVFPPRMGEPLFTSKQIKALLIPLIIEQVLSATIGIIDTIMVAQVGEHAMSGVSLVDSINMLLINVFAALATGGTIVTSQYLGGQRIKNARFSAQQAYLICVALAAAIMGLCLGFRRGILSAIYGSIDKDVMDSAVSYFLFTAISYPFIAQFVTCSALFRVMGNARLPMRVSIVMNLINVVGNAIFIFVFNMGAAGAALSTLISRIFGGMLLTFRLLDPDLQVNLAGIWPIKLDIKMIKNILSIGIPNGIENGIFQIGKVLVQSIVSSFGTIGIAAAAVAHSLSSIAIMPGMAIGIGLVAVAGQCVGAGKYDQARRYAVGFTGLSMASITFINIFIFLFMRPIISAYGVPDDTALLARSLILCTLLGTSVIWPLGFTLPNALRAAGDAKYTMFVAVFSMWAFRVGLGYVLSTVCKLGVIGIWYAMVADWVFRTLFYVGRFLTDRWTNRSILLAPADVKRK